MQSSDGQKLAIDQLRRIAGVDRSPLSIVEIRESPTNSDYIVAHVKLDCRAYAYQDGGLKLGHWEGVKIHIHSSFPYSVPEVYSVHRKFSGTLHVQWGKYLCLYLSTETQWNPSAGMVGLINQLGAWFENAAAGSLDPIEGPIHPPIAYASAGTPNVIATANTPMTWPWTGVAHLRQRKPGLLEITEWRTNGDVVPENVHLAVAILLDFPLTFEYPSNVQSLFSLIEKGGIEKTAILAQMLVASQILDMGQPMYIVLGAPSRGVVGDLSSRQQHLSVWEIQPADVMHFRGFVAASELEALVVQEKLSDDTKESIQNIYKGFFEWQKNSAIKWCSVVENRPDIVVRRDADTPADWYLNRSVTIWGCGALGSLIAEHLARSGVSKITLIDNKLVTPGVLIRQNYIDGDLNESKVEALKQRLLSINPEMQVEAILANVVTSVLVNNDWQKNTDLVIDATASNRVRHKLEAHLKSHSLTVPIAAMMISGEAKHGSVVTIPAGFVGGTWDIYRRLGITAKNRTWMSDWVAAFWSEESVETPRQPEPGCSDPTFIASHADVASLAARMLNELTVQVAASSTCASGFLLGKDTATHRDHRFSFEPYWIISGQDTTFRLTPSVWRDVNGWIKSNTRTRGDKDETGGILFGLLDESLGIAWVSQISGPLPDSQFSPELFTCGVEGLQELCENYKANSHGAIQYLGTWHTHPVSKPEPSETDFQGIFSVFESAPDNAVSQLMLIVGFTTTESPQVGLWEFKKPKLIESAGRLLTQLDIDGDIQPAPEPLPISQKVGMALSGGGSRAVAFHLGSLRALHDVGLLEDVNVVSGVSGGSVATCLFGYSDLEFDEIDAIFLNFLKQGLVKRVVRKLLNPKHTLPLLASFILASTPSFIGRRFNIRWPLKPFYSFTHIIAAALTDEFGNETCDARTRGGKDIVLNACELKTGTAFRMSNKVFGSWRFGWLSASKIKLTNAIAASAAYPAILAPFNWSFNFDESNPKYRDSVIITDGGVYENLGVSVMEPGRSTTYSPVSYDVDWIFASDAAIGQFDGNDEPFSWRPRMIKAFSNVMRKVQDATKSRLHKYIETGELEKFVYVNLGAQDDRILRRTPNWVAREEVYNYPTDFSSMKKRDVDKISNRAEAISRALITQYLFSD